MYKLGSLIIVMIVIHCSVVSAQIENSLTSSLIESEFTKKHLLTSDVKDVVIIDNYTSKGIHHLYFKQAIAGIPIYNTHGGIHMAEGSEKAYSNGTLIGGLNRLNIKNGEDTAFQSISAVAAEKGYNLGKLSLDRAKSKDGNQVYVSASLSRQDIIVKPYYYQIDKHTLELCNVFTIASNENPDVIEYVVSRNDGRVIHEHNFTVYCSFDKKEVDKHHKCEGGHAHHHIMDLRINRAKLAANDYHVVAMPVESPNFGSRSIVNSPWLDNPTASPNGWHQIGSTSYTVSKGNNVDAYVDADNSNSPTGGDNDRVDGGANLEFDFPWAAADPPTNYQDASLTNLFYWNNVIHDVWYNYGFDEPSGNFQEENFTSSGSASDYVNAEGFDGSGTCNANMSTQPDGFNPRMQMYLCNGRDGNLDNGVVVHEYGHGISIRLTGGPGTASCLPNNSTNEQMGEGWSDYFGTVMTIQAGDVATDPRPMGTWLIGQGPNDAGIRPKPYSTDFAVNDLTYDNIKTLSVPHGVGSVWATMIWDMTWDLIDKYGFDPDIYNGTGGNNIAMSLVIEGLKLQPCGPGFVDGRDAILQADQILYGGANQCLIWQSFARRGLGYSADQGASTSRSDGTEAFDMPPSCNLQVTLNVDKLVASPGEILSYDAKVLNKTNDTLENVNTTDIIDSNTSFISANLGGTFDSSNGTISWSLAELHPQDSVEYAFGLQVNSNVSPLVDDFYDDQESGTTNWAISNQGSTSWTPSNSAYSGSVSWFAIDAATSGTAALQLDIPLGISASTTLTFMHSYDTEAQYDGGVVEISTDNGTTWQDLESNFISNGYNSTINNSRPAFSGNSNGYIASVIDLSAFAGKLTLVRFVMSCDGGVGGNGWYIDDVVLTDLDLYVGNTITSTDGNLSTTVNLATPTKINAPDGSMQFTVTAENCIQGQTGGSLTVLATGGSGNYTYSWDNGATTATNSNLTDGFYTVTVSDGTVSRSATRLVGGGEGIELTISGQETPVSAAAAGSIDVTISGGVQPYSYNWSNGETTEDVSGLSEGSYSLTVTDSGSCTNTASFDIEGPATCQEEYLEVHVLTDQYQNEVSLVIRETGGTVLFEKTNFTDLDQGEVFITSVCIPQGCYEVEIGDTYGDGICKSYSSPQGYFRIYKYDNGTPTLEHESCDYGSGEVIPICYEDPLTVSLDKIDIYCNSERNGSITAEPTGGSGNYTYTWSNGATTKTISNLPEGQYTVTVTSGTTDVSQTTQIIDTQTSLVSNNANSGEYTLRAAVVSACEIITIDVDQPIALESPLDLPSNKQITGLNMQTITMANGSYIFKIGTNKTLSLTNLTLDGATDHAIKVDGGSLNITDCVLQNNTPDAILNNNNGSVNIDGQVIIK